MDGSPTKGTGAIGRAAGLDTKLDPDLVGNELHPNEILCLFTPLAIIGIGCLFPKANSLGTFWANLKNGVDAITPVPGTHWNPADYFDTDPKKPDVTYAQRGGFLDPYPFPPGEFGIAPNDLEATDTAQLLGLVAARMALEDAGIDCGTRIAECGLEKQATASANPKSEIRNPKSRISVILGVTGTLELVVPLGARLGHPRWRKAMKEAGVPDAQIEDAIKHIGDSYVGWQVNSFPGLLGNVVAGRIANRLDLQGTNCVVDAACASSLSALHLASLELAANRADVVVTGGIDTFNDIFMYMCFSKTPALSPTGDARPFSVSADGTILGEGLGVVVLKRLSDAERNGDRIYAVIRGLGSSSDGKGNAIYAPSVDGQIRCLREGYRQAAVSPATVELVEGHGTGTKVGDATEIQALTEVFEASRECERSERAWCALGSVKSQIGHTKAAAGAAGLIKAALALYHKVLPPTIKVEQPAEAVASGKSPFYVNTQKRPWLPRAEHPRRAGVSAFGFGGSNFHCVLEEHRAEKPGVDWGGDVQIIAFSAASVEDLKSRLSEWSKGTNGDEFTWEEIAARAGESRQQFRVDDDCRLLLVASREGSNISRLLDSARGLLDRSAQLSFAYSPDGVFFGRGTAAGKLAVLFPGQGSQYVGMLRDLACQFPAMQQTLADANRESSQDSESRLSDLIFPPRPITSETKAEQDLALRATQHAQPAIGAVSLGALHVLHEFGVFPEAVAGHSYGELTALCAAEVYDAQIFRRLSRVRGRLMADAGQGNSGAMLAVHAAVSDIERVLADEQLDLVIANRNAPLQSVLSGRTSEIERAEKAFAQRQLRVTRLPVAAAFHSKLVAPAAQPFRATLDQIFLQPPRLPVFANFTGSPYPDDPIAIRELLGYQLSQPVNFVAQIGNMLATGIRTFLEVGPGSTLTRLVEAILKVHSRGDADVFALDALAGRRSGILDLAFTIARLAARGHSLDLTKWEPNSIRSASRSAIGKPVLTVPICGANYVKPKVKRPPAEVTNNKFEIAQPKANSADLSSRIAPVSDTKKTTHASDSLAQIMKLSQESLAAFQKLQEQTAQVHRQFLAGQEAAQQALNRLVEQQQQLAMASLGLAPLPTAPAALPPQTISRVPPVPVATPKPLQAVPPTSTASVDSSHIQQILLDVVAQKTGYPAEMLDLDMGLDSDLGIDSIKRVEILSALQERLPDAPAAKPEDLGTLNTLRQIVTFLENGTNVKPASPLITTPAPNGHQTTDMQRILLDVVAEKTGYPVEMLELNMGLDADLGIDSIKRVEIFSAIQERLPGTPAVKPEHLSTLNTLNQIVDFLTNGANGTNGTSTHLVPAAGAKKKISRLIPHCTPWIANSPRIRRAIGQEVLLIAEDEPLARRLANRLSEAGLSVKRFDWQAEPTVFESLGGLVLLAPEKTDERSLLCAFRWLRGCAIGLRRGGSAIVRTITRLGGQFGFDGIADDMDAISGGFAGLAKTARHEWPEVDCRAIDFDPHADVGTLVQEITTMGPPELGINRSGRWAVELRDTPVRSFNREFLDESDVVVISGGARGITATAAIALAESFKCSLVLLGRSPTPTVEPDWLQKLSDETQIKHALSARLNGVDSPREIARRYQEVRAQREIRQTLSQILSAGARVTYRSVNICDGAAVAGALAQIRSDFGPITGIVHGAGIIEDRLIEQKTDEQFERVVSTKVSGIQNLLSATKNDPLKIIALFSSSTGRFGRKGQIDYAVANEVLNKIAQQQARQRAACRVVALNWGPWEGGMVTPGLAQVFENEGIGLIPLADGAQFLLQELSASDGAVEVVAGVWNEGNSQTQPASSDSHGLTQAFEREIGLSTMPVLASHVIDDKPVLPLVLHIEFLAHAAMHCNPGLMFHGVDELDLLKGMSLEPSESRLAQVFVGKVRKRDEFFSVPVELRSRVGTREFVHSRAEIVLASRLPAAPATSAGITLEPYRQSPAEFYEMILFHGPELRGLSVVEGMEELAFSAKARTAPPPSQWLKQPLRSAWLADPLALDCAFQAMVLWGVQYLGAPNLPSGLRRYRQFRREFPSGEVHIAARIVNNGSGIVRADFTFLDQADELVARIECGGFVQSASLAPAFRRHHLNAAVS